MAKDARIFVAGHRGLVGSAILRRLQREGYTNILTRPHEALDLTRQADVEGFFLAEKIDYVFLAAAKVGGIVANASYPADFIYINLAIALNVINSAYRCGVKKLLNLGSSCIYPRLAPQPMKEEALLTGPLEPTNEAYAIAKIAALRLCKHYNQQYGTNFLSAMPTNMYGPGDNYDLENSHVLPAMIRKIHDAKLKNEEIVLWGDGSPLREFLYSDDLGDACLFLMNHFDARDIGDFINVGSGTELSIRELAEMVCETIGYKTPIHWDPSKPNGTPRKLMDSTRLFSLGWKPQVPLDVGIRRAYEDFLRKEHLHEPVQ
jgi:GDP-L-fucose synthase